MIRHLAVAFVLLGYTSAFAFSYPRVPVRHKTPGELCTATNPHFVEYRYRERIPYCRRNVSEATKARIYDAYGIPQADRGQYTIDHLIPLSIGGSNSPKNLWPEHKAVKATRPNLEQQVFEALKDGAATQKDLVEHVLTVKFDPSLPSGIDDSEYASDEE